MKLLGIDVGSSSVKVSVLDAATGESLGRSFYPKTELPIESIQADWAEQGPDTWWDSFKNALAEVGQSTDLKEIKAIGISYQMHGLVAVDDNQSVVRPAIIWCDSRAVEIGEDAFKTIGKDSCLTHLLNSPGNFTASKLAWVKANEPEKYAQIKNIMLPGDYIAMRLTGNVNTTSTGLSEGILWDFEKRELSKDVVGHYGFDENLIPEIAPTIGEQGTILTSVAEELGLSNDVLITYRGGDQPNNALSLNVFEPGEVATTAGTSAVIYAVADQNKFDYSQRVNTFLHVNDTPEKPRNGILLCVNGSGILYNWIRRALSLNGSLPSYEKLNEAAEKAPIGTDGVHFFPFGNGAERVLNNKNALAHLKNLNFNLHDNTHMVRAAQEGIVFAMNYGLEVFSEMNIPMNVMKAGSANLFLSRLFREAFVNTTNTPLELFETDGAEGAARAAGVGAGYWTLKEAFGSIKKIDTIDPDTNLTSAYQEAYQSWKSDLNQLINS